MLIRNFCLFGRDGFYFVELVNFVEIKLYVYKVDDLVGMGEV